MIALPSIERTRTSDSTGTPSADTAPRPPSNVFSTSVPTPTTRAPAAEREAREAEDRGARGEEVVHDQDALGGAEVLGRDDQLDGPALRVGRGERQENLVRHRDRLRLAGVDHGDPEMQSRCDRGRDARDLGREDLRRSRAAEAPRKLFAARVHETRVHLVVDEAVHLEDPASEVPSVAADPLAQDFGRAQRRGCLS